jgi:EAL domain-containing protein (putative c-di-GMP-specific phosphodiesterase class I)
VTGRVLVVDDEPDFATWASTVLRGCGLETVIAGGARSALNLIRERKPRRLDFDTILSDIRMPELSGIDLLLGVRNHDADLPVILLTGEPTIETAIRAVELGAVRYLLKPVSSEDLIVAVSRGLHLRRMALLRRERLIRFPLPDRTPSPNRVSAKAFDEAVAGLWTAFQPIVHARSGGVFGHEILVRTDAPDLRSPESFLGAGELLGRVGEITRGVWNAAAAALDGGEDSGTLFVNLHVRDLDDADLMSALSPLAPHSKNVILELTERASLLDVPDIGRRLATLRELGFRVAVDDLGAGYSGLSTFVLLKPDVVKLDSTLIHGVHQDPTKQRLIGSMTALCRDLGIQSVAEGIESEEDRDAAAALDCDLLQGYFIGLPERRDFGGGNGASPGGPEL